MLGAVFRKRGMRHQIHSTSILAFGGKFPFTVSEMDSFSKEAFYINDRKTLRTYVLLNEVTYAIRSSIVRDPDIDPEDTQVKFEQIFERRVANGQVFDTYPTIGPKEYIVDEFRFATDADDLTPLKLYEDLGIQPYDQDFREEGHPWYYAHMEVSNGTIEYPTWSEVKQLGLRRVVWSVSYPLLRVLGIYWLIQEAFQIRQ